MFCIDSLLGALDGVRTERDGQWNARCPAHEDRRNSLAIALKSGRILLHCFAGCSRRAILLALGVDERLLGHAVVGEVYKSTREEPREVFQAPYYAVLSLPKTWQSITEWTYRYADGSQAFLVYRLSYPDGKKDIRPVCPCEGGYRWGLPPAPRPLYRLPEALASDSLVVICEGEKATDAVVAADWVAVTSCGGASAARKSDWSPLALRNVLIWPDNDEPGLKYAAEIATTLVELGCRVTTLKPVGEPGDDAADCDDVNAVLLDSERMTETRKTA